VATEGGRGGVVREAGLQYALSNGVTWGSGGGRRARARRRLRRARALARRAAAGA
jgi:hypothetical protein